MPFIRRKKSLKRFALGIATLFVAMNMVAFFHAHAFTHFAGEGGTKTKNAKKLSPLDKASALVLGVNNPRPQNTSLPSRPFEVISLQSNKKIVCWLIPVENSKGTVAIFHGYSGEKSSMLDKSDAFNIMGYNTLLVDFMGSGGSEGSQTTIGFKEAEEVKTCFAYLAAKGEQKIYLFGTSMGAVAILKAISDYALHPAGIVLECPFGSMYETTCARFNTMGIPTFPMAGLLVFWGGVQNGFWAFGHQPTAYAKAVTCPTLLLYGEKDEKVSRQEIDAIFANLCGYKMLRTYPLAGHENYLLKYRQEWLQDVAGFLSA